jgi:PPOX class probable FMN-dependent enzyme
VGQGKPLSGEKTLRSAEAVREHYGQPGHLSLAKELDRFDHYCMDFIALSPFIVISSADKSGSCNATPRGDAPGFVSVLNEKRLLIPDRRGNNRADAMMNLVENPYIGLLFLVPGLNEILRVNGRVEITIDPDLLAPLAAQGRVPTAALDVSVQKVFFQCGKAVIRSELWNPDRRIPKGAFPALGRILADQIAGTDAVMIEKQIEESYKSRLY